MIYDDYKKNYCIILILVYVFVTAWSCSKYYVKVIPLNPPLKEFAIEDEKYYYIKGISSDALKIEEAETNARANAYQKIIEMICIRVDSSYESKRQNNLRNVVDKIFVKGGGFVREAKVIATSHVKKEIHSKGKVDYKYDASVIVKYPKKRFHQALLEVDKYLKLQVKSCFSLLKSFKRLNFSRNYTKALSTIAYAGFIASQIDGLTVAYNNITGYEISSMVNVELNNFITSIDITTFQESINVYKSDAQNIPLRLKITARNRPLSGIPFEFKFTKGTGKITEKAISSRCGSLTTYASMYSVGDYEIMATVNFNFQNEDFKINNLSKRFIFKVLSLENNKRIGIIGFIEKSKRRSIPADLLINEIVKILSQMKIDIISGDSIETSKLKKALKNDRNALRSIRKKLNTRFIGIIYCKPVSGGKFEGIYHSKISGYFSIIDTLSYKAVYSVSIDNVLGYQLSPEKAEQTAIINFKKKLNSVIKADKIQKIIK